MFFTQMPKGGDLHHHYSGAIYAEQYLDFLDKQGYCVNKQTYRIETDKAVIAPSAPSRRRSAPASPAPSLCRRLHLPRAAAALVEQGLRQPRRAAAAAGPPVLPDLRLLRPGLERELQRRPAGAEKARDRRERQLHRDHVQDGALHRQRRLRRAGLAAGERRRRPAAEMRAWMAARARPGLCQSIADFVAKIDEAPPASTTSASPCATRPMCCAC
jgi:hypothetical protein